TEFPRRCLLVDDETQGAQIVILEKNQLVAGDFIRLIYNTHKGKPLELDAEGVGFADGAFYVIGSHGRPRNDRGKNKDDEKAEARRDVFRIRFDLNAVDDDGRLQGAVDIRRSTALSAIIKNTPKLRFNGKLEENGLTIEGVAVRGQRL